MEAIGSLRHLGTGGTGRGWLIPQADMKIRAIGGDFTAADHVR